MLTPLLRFAVFCTFWVSAMAATAAESCAPKWEYKLLHMDDSDAPMVERKEARDSVGSFLGMLNRLGDAGWELASSNKVELLTIALDEENITHRVQFESKVALLKRQKATCR